MTSEIEYVSSKRAYDCLPVSLVNHFIQREEPVNSEKIYDSIMNDDFFHEGVPLLLIPYFIERVTESVFTSKLYYFSSSKMEKLKQEVFEDLEYLPFEQSLEAWNIVKQYLEDDKILLLRPEQTPELEKGKSRLVFKQNRIDKSRAHVILEVRSEEGDSYYVDNGKIVDTYKYNRTFRTAAILNVL